MMKEIEKPSPNDVFAPLSNEYQYPIANLMTNATDWILSQDFKGGQSLVCMKQWEEFVDHVAKSTELPFVFDKTLQGTILKKKNRLGRLFYDLLMPQYGSAFIPDGFNRNLMPPASYKIGTGTQHRYEVSENLKSLYSVASTLNFNQISFTFNPMSVMSNDGVREGELINSFVIRLREAINRKGFKSNKAARKKEFTHHFAKSQRYLDRLYENSPSLFSVRIAIGYGKQYAAMPLERANADLMKFFEPFEKNLWKISPVGWWWKREYMTEVGYRHYLILFFDGQSCPLPSIFLDLQRHWLEVTHEQGLTFTPIVPDRDYQRCGLLPQAGFDNRDLLLSSIQRMLMRDIYLRLERSPKCDHVGMGKLPTLLADKPQMFSPPIFKQPLDWQANNHFLA
jgi:hypothetical protein